jgi:hypothetical protein
MCALNASQRAPSVSEISGDETTGEDVGKIGNLCWQGRLVELLHGMHGGRWECKMCEVR